MKRIYDYILLSAFAFLAIGCIDKNLEPDTPSAGSGDAVKFGLSLEDPKTRTIYGAEDNNAFPIYWSEGDKVLVASPQCAVKSAEYGVTPVSGQSYAEALNKTGAAGVQWGNTDADFYSVYPSKNASWISLDTDNVIAKLNIASEQSANIVLDGKAYCAADMGSVIMYAQTNDVANGTTVDLKYKPYSTMLEFELNIGNIVDEQGNIVTDNQGKPQYGSAKIVSLTLTAPEDVDLNGDFSLKFNGSDLPTITAAGNNGNSIKMDFATQPVLDSLNQTLKAKLAMIPLSGVKINDWTFTVEYIDGESSDVTTKTKTLTIDKELKPGMIHKIKMPVFPTKEKAWEPKMSEWISKLYDYKNIYITELSLPGAWYAGSALKDNYQATASISDLWDNGVRAYAVECRSFTERTGFLGLGSLTNTAPTRVCLSGTGTNKDGAYTTLAVSTDGTVMTYISTLISELASEVASSNEFAVMTLNYADGGSGGHRQLDYEYFINGVKNEIKESGATNIYTGPVTANTTVNDVIGQLIIKINVDMNLTIGSYDGSMSALISYNPFLKQLTDIDYSEPLFSKLYWGAWDDGYKSLADNNTTDFLWCFSSANRTQEDTGTDTSIPTYTQRKTALRGMINHSKELTESKKHNVWFYFNVGGTQAKSIDDDEASPLDFATEMNSWLYDLIRLKANGGTDTNGVYGTENAYIESDPSPLGIVMFNHCTNSTYYGPEIIKEIVYMNNKADLLRNESTNNSGGGDEGDMGEE